MLLEYVKKLEEENFNLSRQNSDALNREQDLHKRESKLNEREKAIQQLSSSLEVRSAALNQAQTDFDLKCKYIRQQTVTMCINAIAQIDREPVKPRRVETFADFDNDYPANQ